MRAAAEVQRIGAISFWEAYEPAVKANLSSCAVPTAEGLILIDPIPLEPLARAELAELGTVAGIVLTNANHERAAVEYRKETGAPILATGAAGGALEVKIDRALEDAEIIGGALTVITLPGAGVGEMALWASNGTLHLGDAVVQMAPLEPAVLPDKYCEDPKLLRASLRKLLRFEFHLMTFAHGLPITCGARERILQLLA